MNPVLRKILEKNCVVALDGRCRELRGNLPLLEGQVFQAWIAQFGCRLGYFPTPWASSAI